MCIWNLRCITCENGDVTMRDYQEVIIKFVKIVERHPEVYDSSLETYRTAHADMAWQQIAEAVRAELDEECTVDEIKTKWKGIRSSFNRFKNRLYKSNTETAPRRKYYLYDSLKFLEPFTKQKGGFFNFKERIFEDCGNCTNSDDDDKAREENDGEMIGWEINVKSENPDTSNDGTLHTNDVLHIEAPSFTTESGISDNSKGRKRQLEDAAPNDSNDSDDLQFFKSILPDIKDFSAKDKRQLKMGVLKLIDDIEDNRKQSKPSHEVTSTKSKRIS